MPEKRHLDPSSTRKILEQSKAGRNTKKIEGSNDDNYQLEVVPQGDSAVLVYIRKNRENSHMILVHSDGLVEEYNDVAFDLVTEALTQ